MKKGERHEGAERMVEQKPNWLDEPLVGALSHDEIVDAVCMWLVKTGKVPKDMSLFLGLHFTVSQEKGIECFVRFKDQDESDKIVDASLWL